MTWKMYQHFRLREIHAFLLVLSLCALGNLCWSNGEEYVSAVGDPRMKRDGLRVALESWNQCNEVGQEDPLMGSPRVADCFDLYRALPLKTGRGKCSLCDLMPYAAVHRVTEEDNKLGHGKPFPGGDPREFANVDLYAPAKELYLASKCEVYDTPRPWHFWMIMLKNGNMDLTTGSCPRNGLRVTPRPNRANDGFPCFGKGCMNHPSIQHIYTTLQGPNGTTLRGSFSGSWDLDAYVEFGSMGNDNNASFYSVSWEKEIGDGSWIFHHVLKTSKKYPWLMNYLRADATQGLSGGYHYPARGMLKIIPESPNFKVTFQLNVIKGGGPSSQFYLMDIGSCWKNNGKPCDGNVTSDVTRYSEMILNPSSPGWCKPESLGFCPPFHTFPNGFKVHRNDSDHFPYAAYHIYCAPGNGEYVEEPISYCDPFSNPQPQEIVQILPHPVWMDYGNPIKQGDGWIGDPRTWDLDVGRLSQSLYFYQDPGMPPAERKWTSINLGTEIFKDPDQVAEWTVSNFDVLVPKQ